MHGEWKAYKDGVETKNNQMQSHELGYECLCRLQQWKLDKWVVVNKLIKGYGTLEEKVK